MFLLCSDNCRVTRRAEVGRLVTVNQQKLSGAYFTPEPLVRALVCWAVRQESDRLLDPSCGDGRFIAEHHNSVGIEQEPESAAAAIAKAPSALVHTGDFFTWAESTSERFECCVGNPPFIRYQHFTGETRRRALELCARHGAKFSGLTSSWAPFLVAAAGLLSRGGRMAFVVPAEIGHAPYAAPLLEYLVQNFREVHVVAVREKLFPQLSEDCWLLYTDGFGGRTNEISFSAFDRFEWSARPPMHPLKISVSDWRQQWNRRLRPFLISRTLREIYLDLSDDQHSCRLREFANIGIGYVSGDNDFFHLRPSEAKRWKIPSVFLHPAVRNGRALPKGHITKRTVEAWRQADQEMLLLRLQRSDELPNSVKRYLDSDAGHKARAAYKCRNRAPWYAVPDVQVPDFVLTYMSGKTPQLVKNDAGVTCTNTVHSVRVRDAELARRVLPSWKSGLAQLSCEIEGHPLGGGMLKLEVKEAAQVLFADPNVIVEPRKLREINDGIRVMRRWRHYGE